MDKIKGGYILKARSIQESDVSRMPPHVREVWDYLLRNANFKDKKYGGFIVKRGQLFRTYKEIREALHWKIGYRKMMYNENHTKKAMKALREALMIATTKALGGVLITICNYEFFQDSKNYESTSPEPTKAPTKEPSLNHTLPDNNKNDKKEKNVKNDKKTTIEFSLPEWINLEAWDGYLEMRKVQKKPLKTLRAMNLAVNTLEKLKEAGHDPIAVLDKSTENSWTGLFPLSNNSNKPKEPQLSCHEKEL